MSEDDSLKYKVKVNEFEFAFSDQDLSKIDLVKVSDNTYNLIKDNRSINGIVRAAGESGKRQTVEINGQNYEIQIKDELDQLLDKMGFNTPPIQKIKEIKAPMPGLVLEIAVAEGQQVQAGEKILILVAMKMENAIMTSADATIKRIAVNAGDAVEKGQLLVELE